MNKINAPFVFSIFCATSKNDSVFFLPPAMPEKFELIEKN